MHWISNFEHGPERVNHAAAVVGEVIYSFGGYSTNDPHIATAKRAIDVFILHTHCLVWKKLPAPQPESEQYHLAPFQRYGHTAVAYGKLIYIWGGRIDDFSCNNLYCFNTETLLWSRPTTTGSIPRPRDGHSACVIGKAMYVFGGFDEQMEAYSQDLYMLDFDTMIWSYILTSGSPPRFRDFHTGTAIGDRMYIYGGRSDTLPEGFERDIYPKRIKYLDTKTKVWHKPVTSGAQPIGRRSHSAFVHNNKIYIFGGYNNTTRLHYNDMYCFNPETNFWNLVKTYGEGPNRRRRQVSIVVDDRMYLFGGTSPKPNLAYVPFSDNADCALRDHGDLYIFDFCPSLKTLCLLELRNCVDLYEVFEKIIPRPLVEELKMLRGQLNCSSKAAWRCIKY